MSYRKTPKTPARIPALAIAATLSAVLMGAKAPVHHVYRHAVYRHVAHRKVETRHWARHVVHKAYMPPPPPWPRPSDMPQRILEAGLHPNHMEGMALHIHQHLDVFYDGKHVTVPSGIGIGPGYYSEVHTHTTWGTIHVESPVVHDFTLGQFFTEWGVPLKGAKVYDDGHYVSDPRNLILRDQHEIAVVYGKAPKVIPSKYPGYHL